MGIGEPDLANYMTNLAEVISQAGDFMDEIVPVHAAKTHLSRLLARVEAGEVITIARGRTPVAKLVPIAPKGKREFGAMRGKIAVGPEFFEPLPEDELDRWGQ
jgi:prevent-host-death family protein